ncbi:MAG: hypothetical protein IVW57_07770 [Ktedonobacterales bacterium]|nr:hypothetical protein [Ktedonobacterales bacterium]
MRIEQWGAGSGALGGLPVGVRLLVPQDLLAAAREILHGDEAGEGRTDEG